MILVFFFSEKIYVLGGIFVTDGFFDLLRFTNRSICFICFILVSVDSGLIFETQSVGSFQETRFLFFGRQTGTFSVSWLYLPG